jgi:DNA-binding NarL/FixJ family response regulator
MERTEDAMRVIVVDEHTIVRQGLMRLLSAEPDMDVVGEAADGKRAIELVRDLLPDVVLMDISMPGMDGVEATRIICTEAPGVQVIGLSAFTRAESGKSLFKAGAVAYVNKADPPDRLLAAIRACAGHISSSPDDGVPPASA